MPKQTIDGYELSYAESGTGDPLVLIHGTLGDQRVWAGQMAALGARYHVMALSLRHCWPGEWTEGGDFTIDRHVADVASFIRGLGKGAVRVLGHSRGGHIAFRLAERHPELVRTLVLAEPGGELDKTLGGSATPAGTQASGFAAAAALVAAGDIDGGLKRVAEQTGGPGAWDRIPDSRKMLRRDNARTLLGQVNENRKRYARAAAEAIKAPTLLLVGEDTQPSFKTVATALHGAIPRCERVDIPAATHALMIEQPAAVNAAVLGFLERN